MKSKIRFLLGSISFFTVFLSASFAGAQQARTAAPQNHQVYSLARETVLQGTVVSFMAASTVLPMGAHVTIQTASGQVDVHLGNAKVLQAGHLELNPGDNVRIVGETMPLNGGTFFAARVVQKGQQGVIVRTASGILVRNAPLSPAQVEALRGVR